MKYDHLRATLMNSLYSVSTGVVDVLAIILLHCASVPTLLALLTNITDNTPTVDIFIFVYTGLFLMFLRSIIIKDLFAAIINAVGFFVQVGLLAMVVFK